jgi:hypothetical protein
VLTEQSTVVCLNQGAVQKTAGQSRLKVSNALVLVDGDLSGKTISGCTTVTNAQAGNKQCTTTAPPPGGVATKLKVGGKGVLLETVQGQTDGTVAGVLQTWSVQAAGQNRLQTV